MINKLLEATLGRMSDALYTRNLEKFSDRLRRQPLMREFWLAEDEALEKIFKDVNDPRFNEGISRVTESLYQNLLTKKKIPKGKEEKYRELCLRNARRVEWDSAGLVLGLHQELGSQWQAYVQSALERMGVWSQFTQEYGLNSVKGKIFSTTPSKPYF